MTHVLLKLAFGLATRRTPGNRWRQLSVPAGTAVLVLACLFSVAFIQVSADADQARLARHPVLSSSAGVSVDMVLRAEKWLGRQFPFVWLSPRDEDPVLPPGLRALPEPGAVAASLGTLRSGLLDELGLEFDAVGTGPDGTIGSEGLTNASELLVYAQPPEGRRLGTGPAVLKVSGFNPRPWQPTTPVDTYDAQPSRGASTYATLIFLVAPACLLAGSCALASSESRQLRNYQLARLGVGRRTLLALNLLETMLLTLPGALVALLIWAQVSPLVGTVPMSGIELFPGTLTLSTLERTVLAGVCVLAVALVGARPWQSLASLTAPSDRSKVPEPPTAGSLVPLVVSAAIIVVAWLASAAWAQLLLLAGVVVIVTSLMAAVPYLVSVVGKRLAAVAQPARWLAGRRLTANPSLLGRTARVLTVLTFMVGVSTSWLLGFASDRSEASSVDLPAVFHLGWRDADPGDLSRLRRVLPGTLIVPKTPVGRSTAVFQSCHQLEQTWNTTSLCSASGGFTPEVQASFRALGERVTVSSRRPEVRSGEAFDVLIIPSSRLTEADIWARVNTVLPAPNLWELGGDPSAPPPMRDWILASGLAASLLILLASVHAMGNQARGQRPIDERLATLGLASAALRSYRIWLAASPFAVAVAMGLAFAWGWGLAGESLEFASVSTGVLFLEAAAIVSFATVWVVVQARVMPAEAPRSLDRGGAT